jgi:hypothetical protein
MYTIPARTEISHILDNGSTCLKFLGDNGAFGIPQVCPECSSQVSLHGHIWRYKKPGCRKQASFLMTSFFGRSRLTFNQILELGYLWLSNSAMNTIIATTHHSPNTVTDYLKIYRELVAISLGIIQAHGPPSYRGSTHHGFTESMRIFFPSGV